MPKRPRPAALSESADAAIHAYFVHSLLDFFEEAIDLLPCEIGLDLLDRLDERLAPVRLARSFPLSTPTERNLS